MPVLGTDGAAAGTTPTPRQPTWRPSQARRSTAAGTRPRPLQTSWPTVPPGRDPRLMTSKFPSFPFPLWSPPVSPAVPTSPPVPQWLTSSGVPPSPPVGTAATTLPPSPPPPRRSTLTESFRHQTSPPVTLAGGDVVHCQVQLANSYREMVDSGGGSSYVYGRALGPGVARLCRVDDARVSHVGVFENQPTGWTSCTRTTVLFVRPFTN